jgi:hypothetical protein
MRLVKGDNMSWSNKKLKKISPKAVAKQLKRAASEGGYKMSFKSKECGCTILCFEKGKKKKLFILDTLTLRVDKRLFLKKDNSIVSLKIKEAIKELS